jgi:hypothetical protein
MTVRVELKISLFTIDLEPVTPQAGMRGFLLVVTIVHPGAGVLISPAEKVGTNSIAEPMIGQAIEKMHLHHLSMILTVVMTCQNHPRR